MKKLLFILFLCLPFFGFSQTLSSIRVNGVLYVPKSSAQRIAMTNISSGLVVYQSEAPTGLYIYNGSSWVYQGLSSNDFTTAEKTKLAGIATGATATSTDATLLNRANHTGTQAISTITSLQANLDLKLGLEIASTYATISTSTLRRLIIVTADENNEDYMSFYVHNGTSIQWIISSKAN